jgi:hypothetical protein
MTNAIQTAIAANLAALSERLTEAAALAKEAQEAMEQGKQNLAIGTVLDFEKRLPETQALFAAAMALHRGNN